MDFTYFLFFFFSAVLLGASAMVIVVRNPVYAALFLVVAFFNAASLWMLLSAEFLAITLVLVYVGAVMVLFLFVLMLLSVQREEGSARSRILASGVVALAAAFVAEIGIALVAMERSAADSFDATTAGMARRLFVRAGGAHDYVYAFLATSVLITAALVGAVLLSKKDLDGEKPR